MDYLVNKNVVKLLGRTSFQDGVCYLSYSCSGIEFEMTGTKAEVVLWSDGDKWGEAFKAWMAVFINDEKVPSKRFELNQKEECVTLFESEQPEKVKITLLKYSEAAFAKVGIKAFKIQGEKPKPTPSKDLKLTFIGDSITCGYGNEGKLGVDTFTTRQENPYLAYAMQTALKLNADYQMVSWSGIGILSSWTDQDEVNRHEQLMPQLYPYTNLALTDVTGNKPLWDFNQYQPQVVVICLGTNDASYTKGIPERVAAFEAVYYQFLLMVRMYHPQAKIICALGGINTELYPEIEKAVDSFKQNQKDENIFALAFENQKEEDGIGADSHPSIKTHQKMSHTLVQKIQKIIGI